MNPDSTIWMRMSSNLGLAINHGDSLDMDFSFFLYLEDSLVWSHVSCEIALLGAHNARDCLEPFPLRSTVFTKVSIMALPSTFSTLSCCLSELRIPDHQTQVFQNTVPTCQYFSSFLFRPSAVEFLPAPKLNHFSLLLSLPTEYWVGQALSASALSHPPLKVKWRPCLIVLFLDSPWCADSGIGGLWNVTPPFMVGA